MTLPATTYDLVLLLDLDSEDAARTKILADAREMIAAQGEVVTDSDWGTRQLAYPIADRTQAQYHLLQFHVFDTELLERLSRTLTITDGVLRFRIVKLDPGTPEAPDMRAGVSPQPASEAFDAPDVPDDLLLVAPS